jgi:hypothetical protein
MAYIFDDGFVIDDETGEIEEAPPGASDLVGLLASRVDGATRQRKEWEAAERGYKRALMAKMEDTRLAFEERGLTASKRQGSRKVQDLEKIRNYLADVLGDMTQEELLDVLGAVKAWDPDAISNDIIRRTIERHIEKVPTAEYVIVSVMKTVAPRRVESLEG